MAKIEKQVLKMNKSEGSLVRIGLEIKISTFATWSHLRNI